MWYSRTAPFLRCCTGEDRQGRREGEAEGQGESKSEKSKPEKKAGKEQKPPAKKQDSKPAKKVESKSEKHKTAKSSSKGSSKPAAALAPPVAAALKPVLPKADETTDPVPDGAAAAQSLPAPANTIVTAAAIDVSAVKRAVEMVRNRKQTDATEVKKTISDPAAQKLVEWVILRSDDSGANFSRYVAFVTANPHWPSIVTLRRKAEATAFQEQPPNPQVQAFFAQFPPLSAKGRFALARVLMAGGKRQEAEALVRDAWRYDGFSQDTESRVLETFGNMLTREDHKARMDRRLYEKNDTAAGVRAAMRLGGNEPLIAKARVAMLSKGGNKAALERTGRGTQ